MEPRFLRVLLFVLPMALLLFILSSCSTTQLEQAFQGKFAYTENNRIINDYCQSCHVHKNFLPDQHVFRMVNLYNELPYTKARECRVCHYLTGDPAENDEHRGTRWPQLVAEGKFKRFQARELRRDRANPPQD